MEEQCAGADNEKAQGVGWTGRALGEICFFKGREAANSLRPGIGSETAAARCFAASSTYWRSSILAIKLKAKLSITLE